MITYTHRFMVVPVANVATAREVAKVIANSVGVGSADGMWNAGLSATGLAPTTHYISSGMIDANFAALLGDASATFSAYQSCGGVVSTLADITTLYAACPIGTFIRSDAFQQELSCIQALGLKLIRGVL